MSVYRLSGELMLGSRLRRIGDRLLADISRVYNTLGIPFEPSWFPLFFLLDRHGRLTVSDVAGELEITRSGASQMVTALEGRGLLRTQPDPQDGRVRAITLSDSGSELLDRIKPVWHAMREEVDSMLDAGGHTQQLLTVLDELEQTLRRESLADRIISRHPGRMEDIGE